MIEERDWSIWNGNIRKEGKFIFTGGMGYDD